MKGHIKRKTINRFFKAILWICLIILILYIVGSIASHSKPIPVQQDNGITEVMKRDNFRKQEENRARQIYLTEQMTKLKDEYVVRNNDLEAQLETARKEELSLQ